MIRVISLITVFVFLVDITTASPRTAPPIPRITPASPTASSKAEYPKIPFLKIPKGLPIPPGPPLLPPPFHPTLSIAVSPNAAPSSGIAALPETATSLRITSRMIATSPGTTFRRTAAYPSTTSSSRTTRNLRTTSSSRTTRNLRTRSLRTTSSSSTTASPLTNATTTTVSWISERLQMFVERIEKRCDFAGLDAVYTDLQYLWAKVRKDGNEHTSIETNDVRKLIKKLLEHYNECVEKNDNENLDVEWKIYMEIFGKEYAAGEKEMRKEIFKQKKEKVKKHNELYRKNRVIYNVTLNYFSDWTNEELKKLNGFRPSNGSFHNNPRRNPRHLEGLIERNYYHNPNITVPASFDWRTKGFVTPVKNQGSCGSCYAIAGNGALEAYHKKRSGNLVILSTQNILDCTWHLGNDGCDGGDPSTVFEYAEAMGVVANYRYPYTMNASHNCQWRPSHVVARDNGFYTVERGDELALMQAVAKHGPVAVAIGANDLDDYSSGIFYSRDCGPVRHGVLVVGYGTDPEHGDYWIVRNCWGYWWGEDGYFRMVRNRNNMCDNATVAFFPY